MGHEDQKEGQKDYRDTVFLPKTSFAMRGDLPKREPLIQQRWQQMDVYQQQQKLAQGREKFILHDGPPYANGNLHMGHALNKTLKDVVNRSLFMMGYHTAFVPGWDCHGLPIEWKIEERYRAKGLSKDHVPVEEFRQECRAFAEQWIGVQIGEFQRLGILGDWKNPYTTMHYTSEAAIIRTLGKLVIDGYVVRKSKPVMWSVVEKTALAEAEVEYHDRTSKAIYVDFLVDLAASTPEFQKIFANIPASLSATIWTTTPWTLPGNRGIAFGQDMTYAVVQMSSGDGAPPRVRILAQDLLETVLAQTKTTDFQILKHVPGSALLGGVCRHPWAKLADLDQGFAFPVPLLPGAHVTAESGTGLVHIAPSHGVEDFAVGQAFNLEVPDTVADDGTYTAAVPLLAGQHIFKAEGVILQALRDAEALWHEASLTHSYPHSWRSKAPLIYRATPQWFVSLDANDLRKKALASIDQTQWIPSTGANRLRSMIEHRPDWCISRQRSWGVPIAMFVHTTTGEILRDPQVFDRIATAVENEGCDVWFREDRHRFLGTEHNPDDYTAVTDILDVWFDAGCTQDFILQTRSELQWPADLYLEGTDQHRGWFQSSLLLANALKGQAPFKAVLTHGFLVDEHGRKMSKSSGNSVELPKILATYGADILRLWTVSVDYTQDLKIGAEILKQQEDAYRRFRNTLRYVLGALEGTSPQEGVAYEDLPLLEQWICHRLFELGEVVKSANARFNYQDMIQQLHHFCAVDLSAFYFDIRKDTLYCDASDAPLRRAALTVFELIFTHLTRWLAPILCFTAEEAWLARYHKDATVYDATDTNSVHLQLFPVPPAIWHSTQHATTMDTLRAVRRVLTGAVEIERAGGRIGSSLQAHAALYCQQENISPDMLGVLDLVSWSEFSIISHVDIHHAAPPATAFSLADVAGFAVVITPAAGEKCPRCWKVLPPATDDGLCSRCDDVVQAQTSAAHVG